MGVFTTQTLLNSVGLSRDRSTSGAVAINWILKVITVPTYAHKKSVKMPVMIEYINKLPICS